MKYMHVYYTFTSLHELVHCPYSSAQVLNGVSSYRSSRNLPHPRYNPYLNALALIYYLLISSHYGRAACART